MSGVYNIPEDQSKAQQQFYKSMARMLSTPEGEAFMLYAKRHWSRNPLDTNPINVGYNIALNEVYKKLQQFQSGELIDERRSPEQSD